MQVVLVMFRADGQRRSFSVVRESTIVGRREDCDLRIPLAEVSRKHCRLIRDDMSVRIEDMGSSNGTYHNEQRIQEATLSPGDTVRVGPVTFMVQIDGVPADEEMQPAIPPMTDSDGTATPEHADHAAPTESSVPTTDADDLAVFLSDESGAGEKVHPPESKPKSEPSAEDSANLIVPLEDSAHPEGSVFDLEEEPTVRRTRPS
jgi:predicted component of type VI protein secretion system